MHGSICNDQKNSNHQLLPSKEDIAMTPITQLEGILTTLVQLCTMLMEFFGVSILVSTAIKCFLRWLKKDQEIRLTLAQGIALALEFKLGGEVLRTVVVREWAG